MKKRLVLALLLVAMVCALFTVTSLAADAHEHSYSGGLCACGSCDGNHDGWTAITNDYLKNTITLTPRDEYRKATSPYTEQADGTYLDKNNKKCIKEGDNYYLVDDNGAKIPYLDFFLPAGKYYLAENIDLAALGAKDFECIRLAKVNVTLCLNGKTLARYTKSADKTSGRCIILSGGSLSLYDCQDTGAITGGNGGANGAGIYVSGSAVINMYGGAIKGMSFSANGAVYLTGSSTFNMHGGEISGNTASRNGGAIYMSNATFNMTGGKIANNKVTKYTSSGSTVNCAGAGIYMSYGIINITGGEFSGNASANGNGGAIYAYYTSGKTTQVTISNCTFSKNTAAGHGGAVYVTSNSSNQSILSVADCTFSENTAGGNGGAVFVNSNTKGPSTTEVPFEGCTFTKNKSTAADGRGGAVLAYAAAKLTDCTMTGNEVTGTTDGRGGAVYASTTSLTFTNCTVKDNYAMHGGVAYASVNMTISGGEFSGNRAQKGTGTFHYDGTARTVTIKDGAVFSDEIYLNVKNKIAVTNATYNGAVTVAGDAATYTVNGTQIIGTSGKITATTATIDVDGADITGVSAGAATLKGAQEVADGKNFVIQGTLTVDGGSLTTTGTGKVSLRERAILDNTAELIGASETLNVVSSNKYMDVAYASGKWSVVRTNEAKVGDTEYEWLRDAVAAAQTNGDVITLLRNIHEETDDTADTEYAYYVTEGKLVIDMNGKTLKLDNAGFDIRNVTITKIYSSNGKGSILAYRFPIYTVNGALHLENLVITSTVSQAISYMNTTGKYNAENLIKDCVIQNSNWHAFSFNRAGDMSNEMMTFVNTDIISYTSSSPIGGQAKAGNPMVKLGQGVRLFTKSASSWKLSLVNNDVEGTKAVTKAKGTHSVTVAGNTFKGLTMWYTDSEIGTVAALTELLDSGRAEKVVLTADITDTTAVVDIAEATLDLNGKELKVNSLIADGAEIKDSTNGSGRLVTANVTFNPNNTQLPVGNSADGYYFSDVAFAKATHEYGTTATYAFNFYLRNTAAKNWLKENAATLTLSAVVTCGDESVEYVVPTTLNGVEGNPVAYLLNNPSNGLLLNLKGIENLENISIAARVTSYGVKSNAAADTIKAAN